MESGKEERQMERFLRFNVAMNVCMALIINTSATVFAGGSSITDWVRGCCCAFTINTVASVIIPVTRISRWFAQKKCGAREGTIRDLILRNIAANLIYVTLISFCMAMLNAGVGPETLPTWLATYPQLLVIGIVGNCLIEYPVRRAFL